MQIVSLAYWDLCEIMYLTARAMNDYTEHGMWPVVHGDNYTRPRHCYRVWNDADMTFARKLVSEAEVVHVNEYHNYVELDAVRPGARMVVMHHGVEYRDNWRDLELRELDAGYTRVVSTLDLMEYSLYPKTLAWLPTPVDIAELRALFPLRPRRKHDPIRIGHCCTVRKNKGSETIIEAVEALKQKHMRVELVLVERMQHFEALHRLSQCDVYVASLLYDIGAASYEMMALGVPVLSYCSDYARAEWEKRGGLPFGYVTGETLRSELERYVRDVDARRALAARGYEHVRKYHDLPATARIASRIYEHAKPATKIIDTRRT